MRKFPHLAYRSTRMRLWTTSSALASSYTRVTNRSSSSDLLFNTLSFSYHAHPSTFIATTRRACTQSKSQQQEFEHNWPEHDFVQLAEACLELIAEQVSQLGYESKNAPSDFDADFSQGVLTLNLGSVGTYVLNTQTPNRQIWMSSPKSGPWRYAWQPHSKEWTSTRDGHHLATRLSEELSSIFNESVTISFTEVHIND